MDRIGKLKDLLLLEPDDPFLQHALALEYIKEGNDIEARKLFENILANNDQYIGSYYHLAQLLERNDEKDSARQWYELGMLKAKETGDLHAYNELRSAYDDLID
jgi:Tfp pilus assembly protein PilF